jgi:PAS domain S-box-containing protein
MLSTLSELVNAGSVFQQALLVNEADGQVLAAYPATGQLDSLSSSELEALAEARQQGAPMITRTSEGSSPPISVVIPISDAGGQGTSALVGRAPADVVDAHLLNLLAADEGGVALLVGDQGQIISQAGPRSSSLARGRSPGSEDSPVSVEIVAENDRRLVYRLWAEGQPWTVIYALPHEAVLALALRIAGPIIAVLLLVMGVYAVNMVLAGRSLAQPLRELVDASRQVAGGALNEPVPVSSEDEIGQLGRALEDVRVTMKSRLSELSLLLEVSQQVSSSLSISEGMPAILQGARQGGQAAGARAVVLNPAGQQPLMFGVGEAADMMRLLDRRLTIMVRTEQFILAESPDEVRNRFAAPSDAMLPVQALAAIAITSQGRFVGMLWVSHSQPHAFSTQERNLLRTLAGQAAGLVENARLFSTAEGGRRRLAAVLASTADAVIVTDQTNRILLINPAMESLFQLQAGAVAGRPIDDVIQAEVLLEALLDDSKRPRRVEMALEDGRTLIVNASTIFSREGQVLGRVAVLHDISQLKKIDELKSEFVATVSHDLRGPLTFMTGYAAMLPLVGDLNSDQREYLARIESGIEQMTALVEDLLDLRRLESGRVLAKDTIVPRELLQKIAGEFAEPGRRQGIRFHVQVAADMPNATGDIILVQRAVSNLVDNAIKYAPKSGVVMLSAVHEGDDIIFSVQDRGPGIARADQLRLFESFYQAKPAEGQEKKGYGLGLAIVKSIAEHHGGRVWFVSLPGIGSTFYLALPRNGRDPA